MMNSSVLSNGGEGRRRLLLVSSEETEVAKTFPLGYRFKPTDRELVKHYLIPKSMGFESDSAFFGCIGNTMNASDFFALPPYDLVSPIAKKEEWYVFIHQDQQSNGTQSNEDTKQGDDDGDKLTVTRTVNGEGFWKSNKSFDLTICDHSSGLPLGFKSRFTYYLSSSTRGTLETEWKLDEYRLFSPPNPKGQEWVVARLTRERVVLHN